jgi:hypothetical protein
VGCAAKRLPRHDARAVGHQPATCSKQHHFVSSATQFTLTPSPRFGNAFILTRGTDQG